MDSGIVGSADIIVDCSVVVFIISGLVLVTIEGSGIVVDIELGIVEFCVIVGIIIFGTVPNIVGSVVIFIIGLLFSVGICLSFVGSIDSFDVGKIVETAEVKISGIVDIVVVGKEVDSFIVGIIEYIVVGAAFIIVEEGKVSPNVVGIVVGIPSDIDDCIEVTIVSGVVLLIVEGIVVIIVVR